MMNPNFSAFIPLSSKSALAVFILELVKIGSLSDRYLKNKEYSIYLLHFYLQPMSTVKNVAKSSAQTSTNFYNF